MRELRDIRERPPGRARILSRPKLPQRATPAGVRYTPSQAWRLSRGLPWPLRVLVYLWAAIRP